MTTTRAVGGMRVVVSDQMPKGVAVVAAESKDGPKIVATLKNIGSSRPPT